MASRYSPSLQMPEEKKLITFPLIMIESKLKMNDNSLYLAKNNFGIMFEIVTWAKYMQLNLTYGGVDRP